MVHHEFKAPFAMTSHSTHPIEITPTTPGPRHDVRTTLKTSSPRSETPAMQAQSEASVTQCNSKDVPLMAAASFDSSIFSNSDNETMSPAPARTALPPPQKVLTATTPKLKSCPSCRQTRSRTFEARRAALKACEMRQQRPAHGPATMTTTTTTNATKKKANKCRAKPSTRPKQVKIMTSKIPGAGLGLFLLEDVKKGAFVARYSGEAITHAENETRSGHYRIKISSNLYLDAEQRHHFEGRYINDGKRAGRRINVRFAAGYRTNTCSVTNLRWIRIFATRDMKAGAELYLDYGGDYWQDVDANTPPQSTTPKRASATTTLSPILSTHVPTPTSPDQKKYPPASPSVSPPSGQLHPLPTVNTSLSPIRRVPNTLQRTPPPLSGMILLQPPSPWSPPTTPPRILGHHNPGANIQQIDS